MVAELITNLNAFGFNSIMYSNDINTSFRSANFNSGKNCKRKPKNPVFDYFVIQVLVVDSLKCKLCTIIGMFCTKREHLNDFKIS